MALNKKYFFEYNHDKDGLIPFQIPRFAFRIPNFVILFNQCTRNLEIDYGQICE